MNDSDQSDRRQFARAAIRRSALVVARLSGIEVSGALVDLSEGGALIVADAVLEPGPICRLHFSLPPDTHCETTGRIVRSRAGMRDLWLAISFGAANDPFRYFIRNLISGDESDRQRFLRDMQQIVLELAA